MKPCIILWSKLHKRYEAWNEDRAKVARFDYIDQTGYKAVHMSLVNHDYEIIPLNSRLARTILDKIDQRKAGQL